MAKLFPWDPWLEMECLKEDMKRLVEDSVCPSPFAEGLRRLGQFRPLADVVETADGFLIMVELPGLEREDVSLEVHGSELAIFGERKPPADLAGVAFQSMERSYGCFSRRFALPMEIDPPSVEARMRAGLLHVFVPKRVAKPENRTISITFEEE
ncbi:Hsp20/alpha crystallin family protein [Desulfomicrobium salsuginis]